MSIPNASKYVIIGAGIHGLSTAYHLALELKKRNLGGGEDILVIDKSGIGSGASGDACCRHLRLSDGRRLHHRRSQIGLGGGSIYLIYCTESMVGSRVGNGLYGHLWCDCIRNIRAYRRNPLRSKQIFIHRFIRM